MKIEIITTKKKLTKAILKQMWHLSYNDFEQAEPLGYIRNIYQSDLYILCQVEDEFYLLDAEYKRKGTIKHYAGHFAGQGLKRYEKVVKLEPEIVDDWFLKYDTFVKKGKEKGQIYI